MQKNYVINSEQAILFQFEYINHTWDFQHSGFFINSEGNVLTYINPEDWNFPNDDFIYSERQIAENISKCLQTKIKIPKEDLQKYSSYINNIASSKVTALKNAAEDEGLSEYICYQFSESTETYKGYLIKMTGDFTCENLNFYSKKVTAWMRDINNSIIEN